MTISITKPTTTRRPRLLILDAQGKVVVSFNRRANVTSVALLSLAYKMSAAEDLLNALTPLLCLLEGMADNDDDLNDPRLIAARAAISKAVGRT